MLDITKLSTCFQIRKMNDGDADEILNLCLENTQYYEYCGKQPDRELILQDLHITPPGVDESDKYYVGFYENGMLAAIMDLIDGYPEEDIAFIGFFMMKKRMQGKNTGSRIIRDTAAYLKETGKTAIMLGIDKDNPQSAHFWKKNGFRIIREVRQEEGIILVAEKLLSEKRTPEETYRFSDDSSDFILLDEAVPDAFQEIRYFSKYNFIGERIDGYEEPEAILTKQAAASLKKVSDECMAKGYRLKIFDAYRPQKAVDHFVRWASDPHDVRMKEIFYPEVEKDSLFAQGFIAAHSSHTRGSTVDLTLMDINTGKDLDMGGPFDYFGELSHPDYRGITEEQHKNRNLLRNMMIHHGFAPLAEEWWHFTLENEPFPDTYFTFPVSRSSLKKQEK